ncbi:MAG: hypothetical protein WBW88_14510, partial [Rhodothermales bacterium]
MKIRSLLSILILLIVSISARAQEARERSEIDDQYKWDLTTFYADDDAWETDFATADSLIPGLTRFKGHLSESGEVLYDAIKAQEEVATLLTDLYVFAGIKFFEDQRVSKNGGRFSRASALNTKYGEATAYFQPEILAIPQERLDAMIDGTEALHMYRHYFDTIVRMRPYTLSEPVEWILALAADPLGKFYSVFNAIDNADLTYGTMLDADSN